MNEYLDGLLADDAETAFIGHLGSCTSCALATRDHGTIGRTLREDFPEVEPPVARIWAAIQAELPEAPTATPWGRLLDAIRAHGLAFAPVPVAALALALYWFGPSDPARKSEIASGATGRSTIHSSGDARQLGEVNIKRWDYVESGFHKYARSVQGRRPQR